METVLITGANRGIGLGFAKRYADRGCRVIATCRHPSDARDLQSLAQEHDDFSVEKLDMLSDDDIVSLAAALSKGSIELDWVISNAGILRNEAFGDWTRQGFSDTLNTNVTGPALLAQALDPMISKNGKIVQLSSGLGSLDWAGAGMTDADSYSVSKAALNMLTVRLALAYQGTNRCVVAMSPGWVTTDMGGSDATLSVEQSVSAMTATIDSLTAKDTGRFIDNQGNSIPW